MDDQRLASNATDQIAKGHRHPLIDKVGVSIAFFLLWLGISYIFALIFLPVLLAYTILQGLSHGH
jgi:hypothetical protein